MAEGPRQPSHYRPDLHPQYEDDHEDNDAAYLWPCGRMECDVCHDRFAISHPDVYPQLAAELRRTRPDLASFARSPTVIVGGASDPGVVR